jgi:hypothetical protein
MAPEASSPMRESMQAFMLARHPRPERDAHYRTPILEIAYEQQNDGVAAPGAAHALALDHGEELALE